MNHGAVSMDGAVSVFLFRRSRVGGSPEFFQKPLPETEQMSLFTDWIAAFVARTKEKRQGRKTASSPAPPYIFGPLYILAIYFGKAVATHFSGSGTRPFTG